MKELQSPTKHTGLIRGLSSTFNIPLDYLSKPLSLIAIRFTILELWWKQEPWYSIKNP